LPLLLFVPLPLLLFVPLPLLLFLRCHPVYNNVRVAQTHIRVTAEAGSRAPQAFIADP
jgi:hypothetical protein